MKMICSNAEKCDQILCDHRIPHETTRACATACGIKLVADTCIEYKPKPETMTTQERIEAIEKELTELKQRLKEEPEEEMFIFSKCVNIPFNNKFYVAGDFAKSTYLREKVLIAHDGWEWVLIEDYIDGRNAVCLRKKQ